MKHYISILFFILFAQLAFGQVQSNCTDNADLIAREYKNDIHYLTERSITYDHEDFKIDIPEHRTEYVLQALTAIFNTGAKLKADSVFDKYCVHEKYAKFKSIGIMLDSNASWIDNWANKMKETGNDTLDNLLKRYAYKLNDTANFIELISDQFINRYALCDSLQKISGIRYAYPSGTIRPGITEESIYYDFKNNIRTVGFIMPWEEGKYNTHHWRYTVDENCMVSLEDSVYFLVIEPNKPYPIPTNCNISASIVKQDLKVYPNPINGQAIISTSADGIIEVFSLSGNILKRYISCKGYTPIDLSDLAIGIYIIKHKTTSGRIEFQKIMKE